VLLSGDLSTTPQSAMQADHVPLHRMHGNCKWLSTKLGYAFATAPQGVDFSSWEAPAGGGRGPCRCQQQVLIACRAV
jgi:hypothetical protein